MFIAFDSGKPGALLEAKMTKLKLAYLEHVMRRQGSLEQTIMLGE